MPSLPIDIPQVERIKPIDPILTSIGQAAASINSIKPVVNAALRIMSRVKEPDLTGFYECIPNSAGKNSPVMLQLNQVGNTIVGWFTSPPDFVTDLGETTSRKDNRYKMPPSCLVSFMQPLNDKLKTGYEFSWASLSFPENNGDLVNRFSLDPLDVLSKTRKGWEYGVLFLREDPSNDDMFIDISFDLSTYRVTKKIDSFKRYNTSIRIPNILLPFFPSQLQAYFITKHICPIPESFIYNITKTLAPERVEGNMEMIQKIIEWRNASDKFLKKVKRQKIFELFFSIGNLPAFYLQEFQSQLRANLVNNTLTIGSDTKSYMNWYRAVLGEELDERETLSITPLMNAFFQAGIYQNNKFLYTLSFDEGVIPIDKILPFITKQLNQMPFMGNNLRTGSDILKWLKVKVSLFNVSIKKEIVETEKNSDKTEKLVDGKPVIKSKKKVWDMKEQNTGAFLGVFMDLGVGLGLSSEAGSLNSQSIPTTTPVLSGVKPKSSNTNIGEIEVLSNIDVASPREFEDASFNINQLKGPSLKKENIISANLLDSKLFELRLKNNINLSLDETNIWKLSLPALPSAGDLVDPKTYINSWIETKIDGKLFNFSAGYGKLFEFSGSLGSFNSKESEIAEVDLSNTQKINIDSYFAIDSADIDDSNNLFHLSARPILEASLAINKFAFVKPGIVRISGYTSPEGSSEYNMVLSQKRSEAILQAIKDAFGKKLEVSSFQAIGLGEEPSKTQGRLKDPVDADLENWKKNNPDQETQWAEWRKVEIEVDGKILIRMKAT